MLLGALRFLALVHAPVASIAEGHRLFPVKKRAGLRHVIDVGRRALHRVHQTRLGIHPDVRFHAEDMKLLILSDLHIEFGTFRVPDVGVDVVVLAGDTGRRRSGGRRGLMDWPVTNACCEAIARHIGAFYATSGREGGIEREMTRNEQRTAPVAFSGNASRSAA